jgi:quercetin dioxygenase-like cupin family protein
VAAPANYAAALEPEPERGLVAERYEDIRHLGSGGFGEVRLVLDRHLMRRVAMTEVFDTRLLRVAPRKSNEKHKHPHESLLYVLSGRRRVTVNQTAVEVEPGDVVFVPR